MCTGRDLDHVSDDPVEVVVLRRVHGCDAALFEPRGVFIGNDAANHDRDLDLPQHLGHQRAVSAGQDREPNQVHALLPGRAHDLFGRQANPLVDDLHPGVPCEDRDLLRAAGVAVESGLAHEGLEAPAQLGGDRGHALANLVDGAVAAKLDGRVHAGRGAVLAKSIAERIGPLARGHPGMGAANRGGHDVVAVLQGVAKRREGCLHLVVVALAAEGPKPFQLEFGGLSIDGEHARRLSPHERRRVAFHKTVQPDHDPLATLDLLEPARIRLDQRAFHVARLDGRDRASLLLDPANLVPGRFLDFAGLLLDHVGALEAVRVFQQIGLEGQDLLDSERPLLVPGTW